MMNSSFGHDLKGCESQLKRFRNWGRHRISLRNTVRGRTSAQPWVNRGHLRLPSPCCQSSFAALHQQRKAPYSYFILRLNLPFLCNRRMSGRAAREDEHQESSCLLEDSRTRPSRGHWAQERILNNKWVFLWTNPLCCAAGRAQDSKCEAAELPVSDWDGSHRAPELPHPPKDRILNAPFWPQRHLKSPRQAQERENHLHLRM